MIAAALLAFLFSVCGISYQFLLVRALDPFVQDEALCQAVTLGVFLLGMGAGAALCAAFPPRRPLARLFRAEVALALLGAALLPLCQAGFLALELLSDTAPLRSLGTSQRAFTLAFFQPLAFLPGLLTGAELPLLSAWLEERAKPRAVTFVLAFSYFGALGGAVLVSFFLVPRSDLTTAALTVSLLNLAGACALAFLPQEGRNVLKALPAAAACLALSAGVLAARAPLEQAVLKTNYLELRLPSASLANLRAWWHALGGFAPVERHQTSYQTIDLLPDRFLLSGPPRGDFAMHINFQPQFSRDSQAGYHESMAFGALNLSGAPLRRALVLGGGDGLLARELLKAGATEVTLVELDPEMIRLAREHPVLRALNEGALDDPRVRVVVDDAFAWARRAAPGADRFDGIFADLPFPTSYDLLKLYSVEFYSALRALAAPRGFLVLDAPVWSDRRILERAPRPWPQEILRSTLRAAGWPGFLAFGPIEPFLFASTEPGQPRFRHEALPSSLGGRATLNLAPVAWAVPEEGDSPGLVNSALRPRRIRW